MKKLLILPVLFLCSCSSYTSSQWDCGIAKGIKCLDAMKAHKLAVEEIKDSQEQE